MDPTSAKPLPSMYADDSVSSMSVGEIELRDDTGKDRSLGGGSHSRSRSRNSWSSDRSSVCRNERLLGENILIKEQVEQRIKWAQRGVGIFALVAVLFYVIGSATSDIILRTTTLVCSGCTVQCLCFFYYKNVSLIMLRRLMKEANVIIILILVLCNWAIDIGRPSSSLSPFNGMVYMLSTCAYVLFDAVIIKSRYMILALGILFVGLTIYNLYESTFGTWDIGVILLQYNIDGKDYTIMKRSTQRSIYLQILLFNLQGMYTMLTDTTMEMMMFATGHVFRKEVFQPSKCSRTTERRTKWAQRGICMFGLVGLILYIAGSATKTVVLELLSYTSAGCGVVCFGVLYYRNISIIMFKRLLKELNVIMILILALCNWAIDIGRPNDSLSSVTGFVFLLITYTYVLFDAVVFKSRYMVLSIGLLCLALLIYEMYVRIFGDKELDFILLQYNIDGKKYTIMKRSTKLSIFMQILLFSVQGMYIMLVDKGMSMMMFATGNIYRRTGTSSTKMKDTNFVIKKTLEIDGRGGNAMV